MSLKTCIRSVIVKNAARATSGTAKHANTSILITKILLPLLYPITVKQLSGVTSRQYPVLFTQDHCKLSENVFKSVRLLNFRVQLKM